MLKIYYEGGSTFFSEDGSNDSLKDAPARGVQAIVQDHPDVGWHAEATGDYYVWKDGRYWAVDLYGLFDYLMDTGLVLFGRTTTNTEFNKIFQQALADADFGRKHGFLPRERKP